MEKGKISVLMPAYNAGKYIKEAVDSLLVQTYDSIEILVGNDASTDNTAEILKFVDDPRVKVFHNTENKGKPLTTNFLYEQASGEFITIHDADDLSHPQRFEKLVQVFEENEDIAMCGHFIQRISEKGKRLPLYREKATDYKKILKAMALDNTDGDATMMLRADIVPQIGGLLRPYFQNNMDYDLALRIIEKYKTTNIPEVLFYYRNVPNSISKNITSYKKLITQQVTQYLAKERAERGTDSLMEGNMALIEKLEEEFAKPYKEDKTLYLRETSARFMYCMMYKTAIKYSWNAVKQEPWRMVNLRTFQYCVRKTLLSSVF